ncbi:MAG: hypothetical protein IPJ34_41560 [Myxococcales bacterium]|nr:hypothetical protein [Myxococcales bacterium]
MSEPIVSAVRTIVIASLVLAGCGQASERSEVDQDFGAPGIGLRLCSPGDSDPSTCKSCVGGVMKSWCATGEFCYGGVCKTETRAAGSACTSAGQCATDHCTDGVCCGVAACAGGCEFCGVGGTCAVRTDRAPKSCSLTSGAGPCGAPGCNGAAGCSYPGASTACAGGCVGDLGTGFTFGGTGTCNGAAACKVTTGSTSCGAYACVAPAGCKTTCASDGDCLTTAFCEAGACKPKVSTGAVCADDRACAAGAGTCKVSPVGKRCCTATCVAPQVCDTKGTGCVGTLAIGEACSTGAVCATGKCHPTGKCAECTADPDCASVEFCDPVSLKCVPRAGVGDSCSTSASCPSGLSCTEGVCCEKADCGAGKSCALTKKGRCMKTGGTPCVADPECDSSHCVDGVCCDGGCVGQCEACDVAGSVGKCVAVKGAPHAARPACPGAEAALCARASCDGATRDTCQGFTPSSVACRKTSCLAGVATAAAACTGSGACPEPISAPCGGFSCDAEGLACRTSCTSPDHCVDGYVCHEGKCEPKTATCSADGASSVTREGAKKPCEAYRCDPSTGNCFEGCTGTAQCAPGFACDGDQCIPTAGPIDGDGGCSQGARRSGEASLFVVAAVGLLARLRRRGHRP